MLFAVLLFVVVIGFAGYLFVQGAISKDLSTFIFMIALIASFGSGFMLFMNFVTGGGRQGAFGHAYVSSAVVFVISILIVAYIGGKPNRR